jgi:hypothetical protein
LTVGLLVIDILIDEAFSLKDKRSVLKRTIKKLRDNFNVAVSEIDYHDVWNESKLALVTVSNEGKNVDRVLQNILNYIEADKNVELIKSHVEMF